MQTFTEAQREELVRKLVSSHFDLEEGIERIIWFRNGNEEDVRLLEVNRDTITTGSFDAFLFAASHNFPLPLRIADVTPDEWRKIQQGEWQLPPGWALDKIKVFERENQVS